METQNQIKRTLAQPEAIKQINSILDDNDNIKRTKLADLLCDQFGFFDPRGERQRCGCLKALCELEQKGWFVLPKPCHTPGKVQPRRLAEPVPEPQGVPDEAGKISELRLILVKTKRTYADLERIDDSGSSAWCGTARRSPASLSCRIGTWLAGRIGF